MMEGNSVLTSTACQMKYSFYINLGKCCLKPQRESLSVQYLQQYRKVTIISFFVTIVGFQAVRHYQKMGQCCYFEGLTNFIGLMVF